MILHPSGTVAHGLNYGQFSNILMRFLLPMNERVQSRLPKFRAKSGWCLENIRNIQELMWIAPPLKRHMQSAVVAAGQNHEALFDQEIDTPSNIQDDCTFEPSNVVSEEVVSIDVLRLGCGV